MTNTRLYIFSVLLAILLVSGCTQTTVDTPIDRSLLDVQERGKLIVGSAIPYEPMEMFDENGEAIGLDIDIIREVASRLGVEIEIIDYDWDDLFTAVQSGEVDIGISSMTITAERSEVMLFSIPYFNGGQVIVTTDSNEDIKGPEDLAEKKVGAQEGTTCEDVAHEYAREGNVLTFGNAEGLVTDLLNGDFDAFIVDYVSAVNRVKENPGIKIVGEPLTQEFYGMPTKMGNIALMDEINEILREMKREGRLKEIEDKWLK